MASVKWLKRIRLSAAPTDGWFQQERYIYQADLGAPIIPVTRMRVKSLDASPAEGEVLPRGMVRWN